MIVDHDNHDIATTFSIADIAIFPWAMLTSWSGVSIDGLDNLSNWINRMLARPAVKRGLDIPIPYEDVIKEMTKNQDETAKKIGDTILRKIE